MGDEKLKLSEASRLCGIGVRTLKLLACRLPAFGPHPLESAEVLGRHAGEPVVFEDVADFVFTEYVGPKLGSIRQNWAAHPAVGTITASRPSARSTRAISASAAAGSGTSCSTAIETTARPSRRVAAAVAHPRAGSQSVVPPSARTARASIACESEAQRQPARARGASQRRGDGAGSAADVQRDPAGRDVQPLRGLLQDAEQPAHQRLHVVVHHGPDRRGEHRLNRRGPCRQTGVQQIEIAVLTSGSVGGSASSSSAPRSAGGNVVFRSVMRIPWSNSARWAIAQSRN